jgi:segregation and condensation protein B
MRRMPAARRGDDAADGETRDERTAQAEAVLFLAREPLSTRRLAQLAGLADGTEARTLIRRLNRWYDASGSAFRAEEVAGGYQLMTRGRFGPWLRRSLGSPGEIRLSAPTLETLAIVAYRQPVMRAEIEAVRGVDCGEILRQLMDRDLVRTAGRADELGRPYRYATTRRFLQAFGLRHLDDLPRADLLRTPRPAGEPPQPTTLDTTRDSGQANNANQPELREAEEEF